MLVILLGEDDVAIELVGRRMAERLSCPFQSVIRSDDDESDFVEELVCDLIHAEETHGCRVVVGWHLERAARSLEHGAELAAAIVAHLRSSVEWDAVLVVPVSLREVAPSSSVRIRLKLGSALGAHRASVAPVGPPFDEALIQDAVQLVDGVTTLLGRDDVSACAGGEADYHDSNDGGASFRPLGSGSVGRVTAPSTHDLMAGRFARRKMRPTSRLFA